MNSIRTLLIVVCASLSHAAFAQCENEAEALKTATQLHDEMASLRSKQQSALAEISRQLDAKAKLLGWDAERKAAFLRDATLDGVFVKQEREKQLHQSQVIAIQNELNAPQAADPVHACTIGVRFGPLIRQIQRLDDEQRAFILGRIAAASS